MKPMIVNVEGNTVIVGLVTVLVNQVAALWRSESRYRREQRERREQQEKASLERRRTARHLRNLRPDRHCQQRGCPLTDPPLQKLKVAA
jgi:hypothetical protein